MVKLDRSILKAFAEVTSGSSEESSNDKYSRGTTKVIDGTKYVKLDGSDILTPISETVDIQDGDRVLVSIENHRATIMGNFSFPPSARTSQSAMDKATNSQQVSSSASDKAQDASEKAQNAINTANSASTTAQSALDKSQNAMDNLQKAFDAANKAQQEVNNLRETIQLILNRLDDIDSKLESHTQEIAAIKENIGM